LVIDSVAKKHRPVYGNQGTQCFHISQDLHVNFEDNGGLMGFEILPIEDGDEEICEIFTITTPVRWHPKDLYMIQSRQLCLTMQRSPLLLILSRQIFQLTQLQNTRRIHKRSHNLPPLIWSSLILCTQKDL